MCWSAGESMTGQGPGSRGRHPRPIAWLMSGLLVLGAAAGASPTGRIIGEATTLRPKAVPGGFELPNGWRITPAGAPIAELNDLVLKLSPSPDGRVIAALRRLGRADLCVPIPRRQA